MVALEVVVLDVFGDGQAKMPLPEQHDLVKALGLDRQDEPLGVGVQIRAVGRQLEALHASPAKKFPELIGEQRIAIVDEIACTPEETIDVVGEVAGDLFHPDPMRLSYDARDLDAPRLDVDDEEDEVAGQAGKREHLDSEEVGRRDRTQVAVI